MADAADSQTSTSLLRRLRSNPTDESAWSEFVERYGRSIYRWCRQWGLQEADAEDVTQNVLLELARQMRAFVYDTDGSFRGWLKTVAYRTWARFVEGQRRPGAVGGKDGALALVRSASACEDFLEQLEQACNQELLDKAMASVRLRVQPHTWEAFRLTALEGVAGAEVAERLGLKVGTVFVARSKVQRMLHEEIVRLNGGESL